MGADDSLELGTGTEEGEGGEKSSEETPGFDMEKGLADLEARWNTQQASRDQELAGVLKGMSTGGEEKSEEELTSAEMEELLKDPKGVIREQAGELFKQEAGPLFHTILTSQHQQNEKVVREETDEKYGEGTYDDMRDEVLEIVKGLPLEHQASRVGLDVAVAQQIGKNFSKFYEKAKENEGSGKGGGMDYKSVGKGRSAPKLKEGLSEDEKEVCAAFTRHGLETTNEQYSKMKAQDGSFESWQAAQPKETS